MHLIFEWIHHIKKLMQKLKKCVFSYGNWFLKITCGITMIVMKHGQVL
jgi:hypothetical protein